MPTVINATVTVPLTLVLDEYPELAQVKPVGAVAWAAGDLLKIDPATNVAALATDAGDYNAIAYNDLTGAQATTLLANSQTVGVLNEGRVNMKALKLAGVAIAAGDYNKCKGCGALQKFQLIEVV